MKEHWNAYCDLSLVHFLAFPEVGGGDGPILEAIRRVAYDDFFGVAEISRINDPAVRKQVAQLIANTHLKVAFGAQPIILGGKLNLNSPDSGERSKAVEALKPYVAQAAEVGARQFVLLSGPDPAPADRPAAAKTLADSIRELAEHGRQFEVSIVLETFDRAVDKKSFIGPSDEAAALAVEIKKDFPDFGLLYDQAHGVLLDENPLDGLQKLKDHLVHAHVGNAVKTQGRASYGDMHPRFGFPGGEHDVAELVEFLRALFAVGYLHADPEIGKRPWVGFEVKPQPGETSEDILVNIKRAWREAWARV